MPFGSHCLSPSLFFPSLLSLPLPSSLSLSRPPSLPPSLAHTSHLSHRARMSTLPPRSQFSYSSSKFSAKLLTKLLTNAANSRTSD